MPIKPALKLPLAIKTKNGLLMLHVIIVKKCFVTERKGLPVGVPMVWREPTDHITNCYFCLVNAMGVGKKNRRKISYPSISSAIRPVPHSDDLPVPIFKGFSSFEDQDSEFVQEGHGSCDVESPDKMSATCEHS